MDILPNINADPISVSFFHEKYININAWYAKRENTYKYEAVFVKLLFAVKYIDVRIIKNEQARTTCHHNGKFWKKKNERSWIEAEIAPAIFIKPPFLLFERIINLHKSKFINLEI